MTRSRATQKFIQTVAYEEDERNSDILILLRKNRHWGQSANCFILDEDEEKENVEKKDEEKEDEEK